MELPAVNHHITKNGFNAEVIIPADTWPEKGFRADVIIRAGNGFEDRFRLLAEMDMSIVEASFAPFIITSPKSNMTRPPIMARYEIIAFPRKEDAPIRTRTKMASSTRACPMKIEGPARHPFLKDAPIVANIMGPGIMAADMPTVKPRIRALISSIMMSPPYKNSDYINVGSNYIKIFGR